MTAVLKSVPRFSQARSGHRSKGILGHWGHPHMGTKSVNTSVKRSIASTGSGKDKSLKLPQGSWCTHMHVSSRQYPLVPQAQYQLQHDHLLEDALKYYSKWDVKNMVFVQPSIYGTDNSCLLAALREITPDHGRGVVEIDPATISQSTLRQWHDLGVRGVRVNLVSVGKKPSKDELAELLHAYAKAIAPLKTWVLETYIPMELIDSLVDVIPQLHVKFAIAHCGNPKLPAESKGAVDPTSIPGYKGLKTLLGQGSTWVKISAPYRLTKDPEMVDLEPLIRDLLDSAPDRVVWAGDWPHTRFEDKVDLTRFVQKCFEWTAGKDEQTRREKLFRINAEELFDVV